PHRSHVGPSPTEPRPTLVVGSERKVLMYNDEDRNDERDDDGRDHDHPNQRRLTRLTSSPPQPADDASDDRDRLNEAWHAAFRPEATSDPFGKRLRKLTTA